MSNDQPTDFNDLYRLQGLDEVKSQLSRALNKRGARSVGKGNKESANADPKIFDSNVGNNPADDLTKKNSLADTPPVSAYEGGFQAWVEPIGPDLAGYEPASEPWFNRLARNSQGDVEAHVGNLDLIFQHDARWKGVLAYCDFSYRIVFRNEPPISHVEDELQDTDIARLRVWFHRNYPSMRPPSRGEIGDAVVVAAQRERFHPVQDYLKSLRHDGVPRLGAWLQACFDARGDHDYLAAVGRKALIGAVARVMRPGCKMDTMVVLEGRQGKGKSTAIKFLFGDWFSDALIDFNHNDFYQLLQGVWGYEIAELEALGKAEISTIKAIMSQQTDRFRPPYGTSPVTFKRQGALWGSVNQDEYLKDYSGNRRFWPVFCRRVDLEWVKLNRDQLWAEALALFEAGENWWVDGEREEALFEKEQDTRLQRDAWEPLIADWLKVQVGNWFTAADILIGALTMDSKSIQRVHQNRLSPIMKALGWKKNRKRLPGDKHQTHGYERPAGNDSVSQETPAEPPPF